MRSTVLVTKGDIMQWSKEFPTKEGDYWFYGYRYGKVSCGQKCKPEINRLRVLKCANGLLYVSEGSVMYESEIEEAHFCPIEYPELPKIDDE